MRHRWLWILLWLLPTSVSAQVAPIVASTIQTTNTSATSISVGCAIGSSTCTGGISFGTAAGTSIALSGGYLEIQNFVPASQTFRLVNNAGTLQWNGTALATGASLSGTTGTVALFTASNAVGNSVMTQTGGNTITVASTLNATNLGGTLSTASQPNVTTMGGLTSASALATVGTITSGTWTSTKIGLAYGGTNADLSGTGGTSQFLRQNATGAAVTVVRPAVSDLTDGSHVIVDTGSYSNPGWIAALSASILTSGTLADARLSSNVPLLSNTLANNSFTNGVRVPQICDPTTTNSCFSPSTANATIAGVNAFGYGADANTFYFANNLGTSSTANPTQITANTDNYSIGTGFIARVTASGAFNLTGIVAPSGAGRILWLVNLGGNTITLKNDQSSTAANRFFTPGGTDYALSFNKSVLLFYSFTDSRWIVLGGS